MIMRGAKVTQRVMNALEFPRLQTIAIGKSNSKSTKNPSALKKSIIRIQQ